MKTRSEAFKMRRTFYDGHPCLKDQSTKRYTSSGKCVECMVRKNQRSQENALQRKRTPAPKLEDWRVKMIGVRYDLEQTLKG